jgi:oligopeptide/dipeptide ABC transporter ATP-binding protein
MGGNGRGRKGKPTARISGSDAYSRRRRVLAPRMHAKRPVAHVLYVGCVAESGPTRAVLDTPSHPYTRMLLACHPDRSAELAGIPGTVPPATAQPDGCRFHRKRASTATAVVA